MGGIPADELFWDQLAANVLGASCLMQGLEPSFGLSLRWFLLLFISYQLICVRAPFRGSASLAWLGILAMRVGRTSDGAGSKADVCLASMGLLGVEDVVAPPLMTVCLFKGPGLCEWSALYAVVHKTCPLSGGWSCCDEPPFAC